MARERRRDGKAGPVPGDDHQQARRHLARVACVVRLARVELQAVAGLEAQAPAGEHEVDAALEDIEDFLAFVVVVAELLAASRRVVQLEHRGGLVRQPARERPVAVGVVLEAALVAAATQHVARLRGGRRGGREEALERDVEGRGEAREAGDRGRGLAALEAREEGRGEPRARRDRFQRLAALLARRAQRRPGVGLHEMQISMQPTQTARAAPS